MRGMITVVWMGVLFVLTCSTSLDDLLFHFYFDFHIVTHPDWSSLLIFNRSDLQAPFYYVAKTGHFIGFGLLGILFSQWFSKRLAFSCAFSYAILTELLQLYFGRDGRLFDIGVDLSGIVIFLLLKRALFVDRMSAQIISK